jgi:putative ABC transport system permease protein
MKATWQNARDVRKIAEMETFLRDLRYGLRTLRKSPGFAIVALVTLALGIGANTAIFSVVNTVLLRAFPYPDAERLVVLDEYRLQHGSRTVSWIDFQDWREQNRVFEDMAAYRLTRLSLTGVEQPTLLRVAEVSAPFFKLLATRPLRGRTFSESDDKPGANRVAVISYGMWRNRFGGDPGIVGKALTLNGLPCSVIGVLPPEFNFFDREVDAYLPVGLHGGEAEWNRRGNHPDLLVLARLKAGTSLDSAGTSMGAIMRRLEQEYRQSNLDLRASITSLYQQRFGGIRPVLLTLFAAVGCILLISSVNVANLLLARSSSRQKELAVRAALGAGRARLIRQLVTESTVLSLLGGALGVPLALVGLRGLVSAAPQELPQLATTKVDGTVLLFTFAVSLLSGLLFGVIPALQASHSALNDAFKENSRGSGTGRAGKKLRSLLLTSEIAIALILVTAAGLVVRSLINAMTVDPGFQAGQLLAMDLTLPATKYVEPSERSALFVQAVQRLQTLSGVRSAGAASCPPLVGVCSDDAYMLGDRLVASVADLPTAASNFVVPGYFEALQAPLLEGRFFTESDDQRSRLVVIVNQSFARRWWPTESAVGKQLREGGPQGKQPLREIVGIVGDVKQNGVDGVQKPEVFLPITQFPLAPWDHWQAMTFVVRTKGDPLAIVESAKKEVQAFDKDLPLTGVQPMTQYIIESLARRKFSTALLGLFGALALILAAVGTYGVMAYNVSQQTQEIGTRMALGATTANIRGLVLREALRLTSAGIVIGLAGALISTRWLASLLFGVRATDPITLCLVAAALVVIALLASYIPMKRATMIAPSEALRCN